MEKYEYFKRCCKKYHKHEEDLKTNNFHPESVIDQKIKTTIIQEMGVVDKAFKRIKDMDPILKEIMWMRLVDGVGINTMVKEKKVAMSRPTLLRKYPQKRWRKIVNEIL